MPTFPLPPLSPGARVRFIGPPGRVPLGEGIVDKEVDGGYLIEYGNPTTWDVWSREDLVLCDGDSIPVTMGTSGAMRIFCRKFEVPEDLQGYLNVPVCIERLLEDGDIFHTDQFGVYRAKE
jgi:hypothetical protein